MVQRDQKPGEDYAVVVHLRSGDYSEIDKYTGKRTPIRLLLRGWGKRKENG